MYVKAFILVDRPAFRDTLKYMRPATRDEDIPHRTKIRDEVMVKEARLVQILVDLFKVRDEISLF